MELEFDIQFGQENRTYFIATNIPFTYVDIMREIVGAEITCWDEVFHPKSPPQRVLIEKSNLYYERKVLCHTELGLPVFMMTISSEKPVWKWSKKWAVVITSWVHPAESNASLVFQGVLNHLLSDEAKWLWSSHVFYLFPCLNPDGVTMGHTRTSLSGFDLNRVWLNPHPQMHAPIKHVKEFMAERADNIHFFFDLHGHSKKRNCFIYGNPTASKLGFLSWTKVRLFPWVLASQTCLFNLKDCNYWIQKSKVSTGRVVVWDQLEISNSYTVETSYYGYSVWRDKHTIEFTIEDVMSIGKSLACSVLLYKKAQRKMAPELKLTQGWLKPISLIKYTGTP